MILKCVILNLHNIKLLLVLVFWKEVLIMPIGLIATVDIEHTFMEKTLHIQINDIYFFNDQLNKLC